MTDYAREKFMIMNYIPNYILEVLIANAAYIAGGVLTSVFSKLNTTSKSF
jgi:hypothetical protein